jgi:hypothetical protein
MSTWNRNWNLQPRSLLDESLTSSLEVVDTASQNFLTPQEIKLSLLEVFATLLKVYLLANGSFSMARHDVHIQMCKPSCGDCLPEFDVNLMSLSLGLQCWLLYFHTRH